MKANVGCLQYPPNAAVLSDVRMNCLVFHYPQQTVCTNFNYNSDKQEQILLQY